MHQCNSEQYKLAETMQKNQGTLISNPEIKPT